MPRVVPQRALLYKRIKRRIKLRKKLQDCQNPGKPNKTNDEQYLVELPSAELAEHLHRSRNLEEISFESEAYDVYRGNESDDGGKEAEEKRPAIYDKLPTLRLLNEEDCEGEEEPNYQDVSHLVLDFASISKRPLLELNSVKPHNRVYYD